MTIDQVTSSPALAALAPSGQPQEASSPPGTVDKEMFLKLLVAQLKYQNPLEPMQSNEFVAQSAQFSIVERLEELSSLTRSSLQMDQSVAALGVIGREITWLMPDGGSESAQVSGARLGSDGPVFVTERGDVPMGWVVRVDDPAPSAPES